MPHCSATSIASVVGAEIAEMTSMPALAHLLAISRLTLPDRAAAVHSVGIPAKRHIPIALSSALWRPASSADAMMLPDASKIPAA